MVLRRRVCSPALNWLRERLNPSVVTTLHAAQMSVSSSIRLRSEAMTLSRRRNKSS